ncbi:hypothetical protein CPC16_003798 [Podila verticillata]|nr:hypothetical protein CPC16_003798 [Podila verticillata]
MTVPEIVRQYKANEQDVPEINLYQSNGKPTLPFSPEELETLVKPKVLISGGGLGGLTLAILLKKANIPFLVFERAKEMKPLGSALALGTNVTPLFKQMGIYDDFVKAAKPISHVQVVTDEMKSVYTMEFDWLEEVTTYKSFIIPRPDMYDILWSHVPRENILLGKRILSFKQNDHGVTIRCADSSEYEGDILVGADGAHSAVRQHLYKLLKKAKSLPPSDDVPLPFKCVCLVGQTEPLDPEEFPDLKEENCKDYSILGKDMCTFLDKETSKKNDSFRNSEWGIEAAEAMSKEVRDFKIPGGKDGKVRTLGDLLDRTPKGLISKVMLEEKVFDTWYGGRTVLLGDVPSAGQGGVTAMHDAVTLANWIATLQAPSLSELNTAFKEYHAERSPIIKDEFIRSQGFIDILAKNMRATLVRAVLRRLPNWIWKRIIMNMSTLRPQASFLPLIKDNNKLKLMYQPSLAKTLPILEEQEAARQKAARATSATAI